HPQKRTLFDLLAPAVTRSRAKRVAGPEGRRARCAEAAAAGGALEASGGPGGTEGPLRGGRCGRSDAATGLAAGHPVPPTLGSPRTRDMPTHFDKYEGIGNDFIVVAPGAVAAENVVALCDRHFGVGADGVLTVGEGHTPGARASMIVHNADGSRPEMCGNGLRCVALPLARKD